MKLAIVTSHPIQYNAPLFKLMSKEPGFQIKVFYTWSQSKSGVKFDPVFGKMIEWDIPLLDEYEYEFVENIAKEPGSHHFRGIDNPNLIEKIKAWNPGFLLVFGWSFKSHLGCMRYFKGKIPVLFRGDSTLLDEKPGIKKILRKIFLTWVYSHIDYALYVGKNNKNYFLANGLKEGQLIFAPHAIDNQRFGTNVEVYQNAADIKRLELGIKETDMVILFAGKLEEKKDPGFVLRLAKTILKTQLKFLIIGNGHLERELKAAASGDPRIVFLDFQNQKEMPVIYRMADIFILPSVRNETWGLAINESMACGRPVVASNKVGCVPDLVIDGETGWVFEPGSNGEARIAYLIDKSLHNREMLHSLGNNAHKRIQQYSYFEIIARINQLQDQILLKKNISVMSEHSKSI